MSSDSLWVQSAQQFQQVFGESWQRALQAFQQIELPALAGTDAAPAIRLAPDKLQTLQKQYVEEAAKLWAEGLLAQQPPSDKRFAGEGWSSNPVAAFSAAAYLLNARTLMGLTDDDIRARLDDILSFADIGEHIDQPIKHYSSGMVVRLGFAVATCVRPDILITDEVLAVGDESFQRKCSAWMEAYLADGGTLLLCSHSMFHIDKLCSKAAWVHEGAIRAYGEAQAVTRDYLCWHEARLAQARPGTGVQAAGLHAVRSLKLNGVDDAELALPMHGRLVVSGTVFAPDDRPPVVAIGFVRADGSSIYGLSSDMDGHVLRAVGDRLFAFSLEVPDLPLLPGRYTVRGHAMDAEGLRLFDEVSRSLVVTGQTREMGLCRLPHAWLDA